MKYLSRITSLLIFLATGPQAVLAANTTSNLLFPKTLKCESIQFLQGSEAYKDPATYFPAFLTEITPESAKIRSAHFPPKMLGQVRSGHGMVRFDFSDGDQYSFFDFSQTDLQGLAQGTLSEIEGTYEDGNDSNHGFNLRALFRIRCAQ